MLEFQRYDNLHMIELQRSETTKALVKCCVFGFRYVSFLFTGMADAGVAAGILEAIQRFRRHCNAVTRRGWWTGLILLAGSYGIRALLSRLGESGCVFSSALGLMSVETRLRLFVDHRVATFFGILADQSDVASPVVDFAL